MLNLMPGGAQARPERVTTYFRQSDDALSLRLQRMLAVAPSLAEPEYTPTPWAKNTKINFALATVRSRLGALRRRMDPPLVGRVTPTADPDVTVEWAKDPIGISLPADAPIVVFLHTITGTASQTRWLTKYASLRGWRSCVFVRRGHGAPLAAPSFNILGTVDDVALQLDAVRKQFPAASFTAMVGVSAGSAQLISYLGRAGASTPVGAACAICPAWDVPLAFQKIGEAQPMAERAMVRAVKSSFLRGRNEAVLRAWDDAAFERCLAAQSLTEFTDAHAPFAMRDHDATADTFYRAHDPMADRQGVAVPTLLLNAEDDFVCPASLARPDVVVDEQPGALLLVTRSGSHVAFNEGFFARGAFHMRVSFDFLDAALATAAAPEAEVGGLSQDTMRMPTDQAELSRGVVVPAQKQGSASAK